MVAEHEAHHGLEHRDVHALPTASAATGDQAGKDAAHRRDTNDAIRHRRGHKAGRAVAGAGNQIRERGRALYQVVVGGPRGIGAILAEAKEASVDNARIDLFHGLVIQAETRHCLRAHVVDQHVRISD